MKKENVKKKKCFYFYHSFPNPNYCDDEEEMKSKGIKIIKSMVEIGFLLTLEKIEWSKHLGEKDLPSVNQKRFCFTYIEPRELDEHCKNFGIFSLQFDEDAIRNLGALPVFYMPSVKSTNNEIIFPSQLLVRRLLIANRVLRLLNSECAYGVMGVLGLLCPTEYKESYQKSLENFKLREWRITGNTIRFFEGQKLLTADPSDDEFKNLGKIECALDGRNKPRQERCLKFNEFNGQHVLSYADYLVTPDDGEIVKKAKNIIETQLKEKKKPEVISKSEYKKIYGIKTKNKKSRDEDTTSQQ